jgi:hypothetical protein
MPTGRERGSGLGRRSRRPPSPARHLGSASGFFGPLEDSGRVQTIARSLGLRPRLASPARRG